VVCLNRSVVVLFINLPFQILIKLGYRFKFTITKELWSIFHIIYSITLLILLTIILFIGLYNILSFIVLLLMKLFTTISSIKLGMLPLIRKLDDINENENETNTNGRIKRQKYSEEFNNTEVESNLSDLDIDIENNFEKLSDIKISDGSSSDMDYISDVDIDDTGYISDLDIECNYDSDRDSIQEELDSLYKKTFIGTLTGDLVTPEEVSRIYLNGDLQIRSELGSELDLVNDLKISNREKQLKIWRRLNNHYTNSGHYKKPKIPLDFIRSKLLKLFKVNLTKVTDFDVSVWLFSNLFLIHDYINFDLSRNTLFYNDLFKDAQSTNIPSIEENIDTNSLSYASKNIRQKVLFKTLDFSNSFSGKRFYHSSVRSQPFSETNWLDEKSKIFSDYDKLQKLWVSRESLTWDNIKKENFYSINYSSSVKNYLAYSFEEVIYMNRIVNLQNKLIIEIDNNTKKHKWFYIDKKYITNLLPKILLFPIIIYIIKWIVGKLIGIDILSLIFPKVHGDTGSDLSNDLPKKVSVIKSIKHFLKKKYSQTFYNLWLSCYYNPKITIWNYLYRKHNYNKELSGIELINLNNNYKDRFYIWNEGGLGLLDEGVEGINPYKNNKNKSFINWQNEPEIKEFFGFESRFENSINKSFTETCDEYNIDLKSKWFDDLPFSFNDEFIQGSSTENLLNREIYLREKYGIRGESTTPTTPKNVHSETL
jgi:hypothetical protein